MTQRFVGNMLATSYQPAQHNISEKLELNQHHLENLVLYLLPQIKSGDVRINHVKGMFIYIILYYVILYYIILYYIILYYIILYYIILYYIILYYIILYCYKQKLSAHIGPVSGRQSKRESVGIKCKYTDTQSVCRYVTHTHSLTHTHTYIYIYIYI